MRQCVHPSIRLADCRRCCLVDTTCHLSARSPVFRDPAHSRGARSSTTLGSSAPSSSSVGRRFQEQRRRPRGRGGELKILIGILHVASSTSRPMDRALQARASMRIRAPPQATRLAPPLRAFAHVLAPSRAFVRPRSFARLRTHAFAPLLAPSRASSRLRAPSRASSRFRAPLSAFFHLCAHPRSFARLFKRSRAPSRLRAPQTPKAFGASRPPWFLTFAYLQ